MTVDDFASAIGRIRASLGGAGLQDDDGMRAADLRWEAAAPKRAAADRAFQAANQRRRAELGLGGEDRVPLRAVADASLLWVRPSERRAL